MEDEEILLDEESRRHQEYIRERRNTWVCFLVYCATNIGFSIISPSLWTYLQEIGAPPWFYGITVCAYPAGSMIGSPLWGVWSRRSFRKPLIASLFLIVFFSGMYAFFPEKYSILFSRFIQGIGAGNEALLVNFVTVRSDPIRRTRKLSRLSFFGTLGFIVGPLLGSVLSLSPNIWIGKFEFRTEALAGIITAFFTIFAMIMVTYLFDERPLLFGEVEHTVAPPSKYPRFSSSLRMIGFGLSYFCCYVLLAAYDALVAPYTKKAYGWSVFDVALLWTAVSIAACGTYMSIDFLTKKVHDEVLTLVFLFCQLLGSLLFIEDAKLWRFILGTILIDIGFSGASVSLSSLYSKECRPSESGLLLGLLNSVGSLARMTAPLFFTMILTTRGPNVVFVHLVIFSLISIANFFLCQIQSFVGLLCNYWKR